MKEGYEWGGWTLDPRKPQEGDKKFLANYFGYNVGDKPKHAQQDRLIRGIDPRSASYEEVTRLGEKPGRKPVVAGTKVHNFSKRYMKSIFGKLNRLEEKEDCDYRSQFLVAVRRLSKKWAENSQKSIMRKYNLSKKQRQHALWAFINNHENGLEAQKEFESVDDSRDGNGSSESRNPEKVIKRMGRQIKARDSRRIDYMLESAAFGMNSGRRDAVTKKFLRKQARKDRVAGKVHRAQKRSVPKTQLDLREMIAKRFKRS